MITTIPVYSHTIVLDTLTEAGHYIVVVECGFRGQPELLVRESRHADVHCRCGIII